MNKLKLSIIIPIYNAEKYLEQCIESVLRQMADSMEIVLIDDGSTDGSSRMCDQYADECGRIRVAHQENRGLIESRKRGITLAKGEYVTFVDSDDWIEGGLFEELIQAAESMDDIDLVISGLMCDKGRLSFRKSGSLPPGVYRVAEDSIPDRMLYDWTTGELGLAGYACGKLFRRNLLMDVIMCVDKGIVHGEDYAWFFNYVPLAKKIVIIDRFLYHYRMHSESMSASFEMKSFTQLLALKNHFFCQEKREWIHKQNIAGIHQLIWGGVMHALREIYGLSVGYIFPYELVKAGSRVIIYGAGVVGKCYYNCLKSGAYAEVAALIDKNWSAMAGDSAYDIYPPEHIAEISYDVVIVAVEPEELYRSIREELKELGVEDRKIIWSKPRILRT